MIEQSSDVPSSTTDTWVTRRRPVDDGMGKYLIMMRAPDDPKAERDATRSATWWRTWKKNADPEDLRAQLVEKLEDGPSTFNSMCVRIANSTADVLGGGPLEEVLWSLVLEGDVQFRVETPILFRLCTVK